MWRQKQKGMAALLTVMLVLGVVTITTLYTARVISTDQKIYGNVQDRASAMQAAQAGFDYGLGFLNSNISLVTTGLASCAAVGNSYTVPSNGVSPLSDGSTFGMVVRCTEANNASMLTLTSTGTSSDGVSTRVVSATVNAPGGVGMTTIVSRNTISLTGNGTIDSVVTNGMPDAIYSIHAGGAITIDGLHPVSLNPSAAFQSDPALSSQTPENFLANYIGQPIAFYETQPTGIPYVHLTCSDKTRLYADSLLSDKPCTINENTTGINNKTITLHGITGAVIYIRMNGNPLTISASPHGGDITLGLLTSSATRDILVVSGASQFAISAAGKTYFTMNGNIYTDSPLIFTDGYALTVNGLVFSSNTLTFVNDGNQTLTVNGALVSATAVSGTTSGSGTAQATYDPASAINLSSTLGGFIGPASLDQDQGGVGLYGVVSGSWKDF